MCSPAGLDTAVLLLRNCDWSRQFVDEVLSYRKKEVRPLDASFIQCMVCTKMATEAQSQSFVPQQGQLKVASNCLRVIALHIRLRAVCPS